MIGVETLTHDDLPLLTEALDRHSPGGAGGVDGLRMAGLTRAVQTATAAVARHDGEIVGYAANLHDDGDGVERVACAGEVFAPWRGHGAGGRLVDWALQHAAGASRSDAVEVVIDCMEDDRGLQALLDARGFSFSRFTQATAPVSAPAPTPTGTTTSTVFRQVRPADSGLVAALYRRVFEAEPLARGGDASVTAALRHPYLRSDYCLLACSTADGSVRGLVLALVWPDAQEDLWIETLCVDPRHARSGLLRHIVADVMRRAVGVFSTVSLGATDAVLSELAPLGFAPQSSWTRNSLLLMAPTRA